MRKAAILLIFTVIGLCRGEGQEMYDSVRVHFRQSHTELDRNFGGNGARLDSLIDRLTAPGTEVHGVRVSGGASPEGSVNFNRYLSEHRASALYSQLRSKGLLPEAHSTVSLGRDWEGLRERVKADESVPYRADVLDLLDEITAGKCATPLRSLKQLHGGEPYLYMYRTIFPDLRESQLVVEYERLWHTFGPDSLHPDIPGYVIPGAEPALETPPAADEWKVCKPFYMGVKTNLLYDAALLPNVGVEFYVGKNWSLTGDWIYGWWDKDSSHRYWRAYGGYIGARRWFGKAAEKKPLTGHHLGAFAGAITYDFEFGGQGVMGGLPHRTLWDRCNFICGVEYGYSLPIARRLNLDFSVAFGYVGGKYIKYKPYNGFYAWESTNKLNYFGPTKVEISLVWLLGCGNFNEKGGRK